MDGQTRLSTFPWFSGTAGQPGGSVAPVARPLGDGVQVSRVRSLVKAPEMDTGWQRQRLIQAGCRGGPGPPCHTSPHSVSVSPGLWAQSNDPGSDSTPDKPPRPAPSLRARVPGVSDVTALISPAVCCNSWPGLMLRLFSPCVLERGEGGQEGMCSRHCTRLCSQDHSCCPGLGLRLGRGRKSPVAGPGDRRPPPLGAGVSGRGLGRPVLGSGMGRTQRCTGLSCVAQTQLTLLKYKQGHSLTTAW